MFISEFDLKHYKTHSGIAVAVLGRGAINSQIFLGNVARDLNSFAPRPANGGGGGIQGVGRP